MPFTSLNPTRSMYMRGFDRRGAAASFNNATETSFQVSGIFSDQADFVVLMLFDADDAFGHLTTSKYLPTFSLHNVILDFDLHTESCFNPTSPKFESVPWKSLSYIRADGTPGTIPLNVTSSVSGVKAKIKYTLTGTPTTFDRILIVYLSNIIFDSSSFGITTGQTLAQVVTAMINLVNTYSYSPQEPLTAFVDPTDSNSFYIEYGDIGIDGNSVALVSMEKSGSNTHISPLGQNYLTGGTAPSSIHIRIDFSGSSIDSLRQAWFTIAPELPLGSAINFVQTEFAWVVTNWVVTDPSHVTPLKITGVTSTTIPSSSSLVSYLGTWGIESGFFYHGFCQVASASGSTVTISYFNSNEHDIYLGTSLYSDRGSFNITVDGTSHGSIDMSLSTAAFINTRRLLLANVGPGQHTVVLTTTSSSPCYFDYLQAAVPIDPVEPLQTYGNLSAAFDFDTDQTYKPSPARAIWILQQLGLRGNIDVYRGVFFSEVRKRNGGDFHSANVSFSGTWVTGTGFGDGAQLFITLAATSFGVSVYPSDTNITIAQRFSDFINAGFVGVRSSVTGNTTTSNLVINQLTPINSFTISVSTSSSPGGTMLLTGDLNHGNEGVWGIAPTNTNSLDNFPLNRGFIDWLNDFSNIAAASQGLALTLSVSQELLAPPDVNTSIGAWIQRYNTGVPVLTATGFGSWGTAYISSFSVSTGVTTIIAPGHGYITGNVLHIPAVSSSTTWIVTVIDANSFSIVGTPSVANGDQIYIDLQTSQCTFNPSTVTPYLAKVFSQAGQYVDRLQFGEILWWFFADVSMAYYDAYTSSRATSVLGRPLATFTSPTDDPSVNAYADTNLLLSLLVAHMHTIREYTLDRATRDNKFEWLCPFDVNWPTNYTNVQYPFNIGGQLNRYVNIPAQYLNPGSDIDLIKMEALAWGTSYRTLDNAEATIAFPSTEGTWPKELTSYLVPVQNGGCPWVQELNLAINSGIAAVNFWAIDHIILFSWSFPMEFIPEFYFTGDKSFYEPVTTTLSYYRTFMNVPVLTPPINDAGQ